MLLKGVEDLYLAELNGARTLLSKLDGEGFPLLKHLHIQNSAKMAYIIDFIEWVHPYRAFPNLESMAICNLINLEKICYGPLPAHIFTKLQVIKVGGCDRLKNLFSFSMVRNLHQLIEIEISECKSMTNIVEQGREDFADNAQLNFPKIQSFKLEDLPKLTSFCSKQWATNITSEDNATEYRDNLSNPLALFDKVVMPNLETIKVSSINMAKLWDDISASSCIQNLTTLTVDNCGSLTYLFSAEVGRALIKLQYLEITNCRMMEEIFMQEEKLGNVIAALNPLSYEKVIFPNLETLVISHMDNLKSIWNNKLAPNPFPKMTKMKVSFCQKLLHLIPSDELKNLHNLETLCVTDCVALEVVFETQGLKKEAIEQGRAATMFRTLTLKNLPMMKLIWSNDPCGSLQFQNLCSIEATNCQSLNHVFPLSVAMELLQLQVLDIRDCGVESIVAMGEKPKEVPRFVFLQLTSLTFWYLKKLRSFYPGLHILDCPIIKKLDVYHCSNLKVFKSNSQKCHQEVIPYHGQPLFAYEKVVSYVEELSLSSNDIINFYNGEHHDDDFYNIKALSLQCFHYESDEFPMDFLQRFTNLENLKVACSSFVELFSNENIGRIMKLKTLRLNGLNKLEYLCDDKPEIQPILRNLETLEVVWCSGLKNIAPSTSTLLLQNLDKLLVGYCSGLVNLITSSLTKSLPMLRILAICNCEMIEEIVGSQTDTNIGEIAFMKLERLELANLPRLTSLCNGNCSFKFPLLEALFVIECPKMKAFSYGNLSTPSLRKVLITPTMDGKWHWDGELNATVRKIFSRKEYNKG